MAKWTNEYINDLPDSAFLYIEKGGKKDKDKKTMPRTLRHLPIKSNEGKIDLPHVKNALARLNQVKLKDGKLLSEKEQDGLRLILEQLVAKAKERTGMSEEEITEDVKETTLEFDNDDEIEEETTEEETPKEEVKPTVEETPEQEDEEETPEVKPEVKPKEETVVENKDNKIVENDLKLKVDNTQSALNEALQLNDEMIKTLNESKEEIESLKMMNKNLIDKLETKTEEITQFQTVITQYEQEKKEGKIDMMFDQYCSFFDISDNEKQNVRQMMSTMSEDMLEQTTKLFSQKRKPTTMVAPLTKPSSSLSQYSKPEVKKVDLTQMSAKDRVDYLFEQFTKQNN